MTSHALHLPMRGPVRIALFAALAAALGFLFAPIPNIELVTFSLFAAGYALGLAGGAAAASLAVLLYFGLNPYGSSFALPPLLAAQLAAGVFIAALGSLAARLLPPRRLRAPVGRFLLLPFAAFAALALPLFPSITFAWTAGGAWEGWLVLGALMTGWGFIFNLIVFLGAMPAVARELGRAEARRGR